MKFFWGTKLDSRRKIKLLDESIMNHQFLSGEKQNFSISFIDLQVQEKTTLIETEVRSKIFFFSHHSMSNVFMTTIYDEYSH